jgi:hypothetical protein
VAPREGAAAGDAEPPAEGDAGGDADGGRLSAEDADGGGEADGERLSTRDAVAAPLALPRPLREGVGEAVAEGLIDPVPQAVAVAAYCGALPQR